MFPGQNLGSLLKHIELAGQFTQRLSVVRVAVGLAKRPEAQFVTPVHEDEAMLGAKLTPCEHPVHEAFPLVLLLVPARQ